MFVLTVVWSRVLVCVLTKSVTVLVPLASVIVRVETMRRGSMSRWTGHLVGTAPLRAVCRTTEVEVMVGVVVMMLKRKRKSVSASQSGAERALLTEWDAPKSE